MCRKIPLDKRKNKVYNVFTKSRDKGHGTGESLTESGTFGVSTASAKPRLTTLQLPEGNNSGRISPLQE